MGGSTTGERGEKLFQELCNLWPPDSVSPDTLRKVLDNLLSLHNPWWAFGMKHYHCHELLC